MSFGKATKETVDRMKRNGRMGEKFQNHVSKKVLIPQVYKELLQLNSKISNNLILK